MYDRTKASNHDVFFSAFVNLKRPRASVRVKPNDAEWENFASVPVQKRTIVSERGRPPAMSEPESVTTRRFALKRAESVSTCGRTTSVCTSLVPDASGTSSAPYGVTSARQTYSPFAAGLLRMPWFRPTASSLRRMPLFAPGPEKQAWSVYDATQARSDPVPST